MGNAIFSIIRNQMVNNLREDKTTGSVEFHKGLPTNVIRWLCKQGVCKIDKVEKQKNSQNKYVYTVFYRDVNKYSAFLKDTVERLEKKGYITDSNDCVTVKFGKIADKYRTELECPNWSSEPDETGYRACPNANRGYEKLSREDSVMFEMFTQWLGYDSYLEYSLVDHDEDSIDILYNHFLSEILVPEYAQGEEEDYDNQFTEEELVNLVVGKEEDEINE